MFLSFGQHIVTLQRWETKQDMLDFLARCSAGSLVLGEEAEQEVEFFSATIHLNYCCTFREERDGSREQRFGIGVCSEADVPKPHLLLRSAEKIMVFGFNREVVGVDVESKEIKFRVRFIYSPFRSLVYLDQYGIILAFHEIGVVALTGDGVELWRYEQDVIVDSMVDGDKLHLRFMDSPPVTISVRNGA
jgi:hypothetical protein